MAKAKKHITKRKKSLKRGKAKACAPDGSKAHDT